MEESEIKRWRRRRILYRISICSIFGLFGFYFWPKLMMSRMLDPDEALYPEDFVPIIKSTLEPVVVAIKEYQRDNGQLPHKLEELVPAYMNSVPQDAVFIYNGQFYSREMGHSVIYNFAPGCEGWQVEGFAGGEIPLPPVTIPTGTLLSVPHR